MAQKTSIKIKKLWYADIAADGGVGSNWKEAQLGTRESTAQFNGSDADVTTYKNIVGGTLESDIQKGDTTMNFQLADINPETVAAFAGGTVTVDGDGNIKYESPENQNQSVELSIKFLTGNNVEFVIPRLQFDSYPIINDDDLHYFQNNSTMLVPEKAGEALFSYTLIADPDANDITSFVLDEQTGAAVINDTAHTVAIEVANGTVVTALTPTIGVSLGGSITPNSDEAQDFTNPVEYTVESGNGASQTWTVTVTVAA